MKEDFKKFATKHIGVKSNTFENYSKHNMFNMTDAVAEEKQTNVRYISVFDRLMLDRIIFLGTAINSDVSSMINAQLLYLESIDPKKEISIYINSPGGSVYDGMSIYDTMQIISPEIKTLNMGLAASMASIILCGGAKGKRFSLKHARVMIHQPHGGAEGQTSDIEITSREFSKLKKEMYEIISEHSGMKISDITKDADRDYWMNGVEAKKYGLIDHVLTKNTKRNF